MSKHFLVAGVAAVIISAAAASAQPGLKTYTDTQNRFSFQYPASLPVDVVARPNQPVNVLVGAADYECQMFVVERPDTADKPVDAIARAYATLIGSDVWTRTAAGFALYNRQGAVESNTVDTMRFWPVQRANMRTDATEPVIAAMQVRPGVEVWQFCTAFDKKDHGATFNQIIGSFRGPNDEAQQAAAVAAAAERAAQATAAAAAAAAAPAPKKEQKKEPRGRVLRQN